MVCGLSSQLSVPEQLFTQLSFCLLSTCCLYLDIATQYRLRERAASHCYRPKLCSTLDFKERNSHFFRRNGWVNPVRTQPHGMASRLGSGDLWDRCRVCAHFWSVCCQYSELSLYGVSILKHYVFGNLQRWDGSNTGYTCWPQAHLSILKLFLSWETGFPKVMCNLQFLRISESIEVHMAARTVHASLGRNVLFVDENISIIEKQQDQRAC